MPTSTGATEPDSGAARLLYIEDDPGQARLVQRALEREGYRVDLARDGREGLALFAVANHEALIIDRNLPRLSGVDVIRTLSETKGVPPTIMLTGAGNEEIAVKAMKLGVSDYLTKDTGSVYLSVLPSVVSRAIRQRRVPDADSAEEGANPTLQLSRFAGTEEHPTLPVDIHDTIDRVAQLLEEATNGKLRVVQQLSAVGNCESQDKKEK